MAAGTVRDMLAALRQRGPDAQHAVTWNAAWELSTAGATYGLLHARLSIIDPRPEADQPMADPAGDVWICYNGEVYGWEPARAELERLGFAFRTRSDTEFLLHGYRAWGFEGLLSRLRGMFALVILDRRRQLLWGARDRIGLKPLVYYHRDGEFAFASTVRGILPYLPPAQRALNSEALDAYLAHRYIPAPYTALDHVHRLENGHWLRLDLATGHLENRRYWKPEPMAADWRETLDTAIRLRTVADRPIGLFLSGGVDSAVLACRLPALGYRQLRSYTAAFPGTPFDEGPAGGAIAARLGLPNRQVAIDTSIAKDFGPIVASLDEPFADPSSFPTWLLARRTAEEVKVVLGGDGGDELLGGYKRIVRHARSRWRRRLRLPLIVLPSAAPKGVSKQLTELGMDWREAYSLRFSGFTPNQRRYLQPDRPLDRLSYWRLPEEPNDDAREALLAIDWLNYLPEYILRKADLCTMAHGLELRAPLLDHMFVQSLLALPRAQRLTQPPKTLFAPLLAPLADLDPLKQTKRGFNPPLTQWLRRDLAARFPDLGERLSTATSGQLAAGPVDALIARYAAGKERLAEQVLQLLILDESLAQLRGLFRRP